jgi:hypothetical protein
MQNDEFIKRLRTMRVPAVDPGAENAALEGSLAAFAQAEGAADIAGGAPAAWTWREWLWPSPYMWGAIAGIWLALLVQAATSRAVHGDGKLLEAAGPVPAIEPGRLTAQAEYRDVLKQIERGEAAP